MSTSDSIVSSQIKQSSWRKSDTTWMLGSFGTAIGAGVLSFSIRISFGGLIPILLILVLIYPIASHYHQALARPCFSGSNPSGNITETVEEHFGETGGMVITFLYFFAICLLLWIYGVTVTNIFMTFWENQPGFVSLDRGFMALFLLLLMALVIWFGKDLMVKAMSYLVWPFIASLALIFLPLIPYQSSAVIDQVDLGSLLLIDHGGILITVWLGTFIMVFSSNFSPIVSPPVVSKREEYEKGFDRDFTEHKRSQIISRTSMLVVTVMMFLTLSCLFTLSPANMAEAKAQGISMLSYLANHFTSMIGAKAAFAIILEYAAFIIALVAIFKSFFGHYLRTLEGLNGLVLKLGYKGDRTKVSPDKLNTVSMIFIMDSTWVAIHANPDIPGLIKVMGAPIVASLLCLLPMYAIHKTPSLVRYRGCLDNVFIIVIGLLTILNIVRKLS